MGGTWTLRETVVVAVLAAVFGILYFVWDFVAIALTIGGPAAQAVLFGFWLIAAPVAAYIVQKPGAALIAEIIAAFVEALAGSTAGLLVLGWGLVQGLGTEVVFLGTGYRNFSLPVMMLSGAVSAIAAFAFKGWLQGYSALSPTLLIAVFVVQVLSGALFSGLGGKAIGDALAATGVLRGFALGQQWLQRRRTLAEG
jgi:energy-coupling factor transport system permease protein